LSTVTSASSVNSGCILGITISASLEPSKGMRTLRYMAHLLFVLEERANNYLFLGLDSAEPVKGSLRNVRKIINIFQ
jgi:hypothetical protein